MQAITTKYVGPTNTRGGRIIARCEAGRATVAYDHALDQDANHRAAAVALCDKLNAEARKRHPEAGGLYTPWNAEDLIQGGQQHGDCFVFAPGYAQMKGALIAIRPYLVKLQECQDDGRVALALAPSNAILVLDNALKASGKEI